MARSNDGDGPRRRESITAAERYNQLADRINALNQEEDGTTGFLAILQEDIDHTMDFVQTLLQSYQHHVNDNATLNNSNYDLHERVSELEGDITTLQQDVER